MQDTQIPFLRGICNPRQPLSAHSQLEISSAVRICSSAFSKIDSLFCRALQGKLVKKGTTQSIAGSINTKSLGCSA